MYVNSTSIVSVSMIMMIILKQSVVVVIVVLEVYKIFTRMYDFNTRIEMYTNTITTTITTTVTHCYLAGPLFTKNSSNS